MLKNIFSHSALRYLLAGASAFLVDYFLLLIAYYVLEINLTIATSIGFISGLLVSFTLNRYWVFNKNNKRKAFGLQSIQYITLLIINYCFTVIFINILNELNILPQVSKFIAMFMIMIWNYLIFRFYIFKERD